MTAYTGRGASLKSWHAWTINCICDQSPAVKCLGTLSAAARPTPQHHVIYGQLDGGHIGLCSDYDEEFDNDNTDGEPDNRRNEAIKKKKPIHTSSSPPPQTSLVKISTILSPLRPHLGSKPKSSTMQPVFFTSSATHEWEVPTAVMVRPTRAHFNSAEGPFRKDGVGHSPQASA